MDGLTGNTLNSHRLIALAGNEGPEKQNALVEALFKAYFTEVIEATQYFCNNLHMRGLNLPFVSKLRCLKWDFLLEAARVTT